jgi:hypothetical protein
MKARIPAVAALFIGLTALVPHQLARADYTYRGTEEADTIYFGYSHFGLEIRRITAGRIYSAGESPMSGGRLTILGLGGDDYIRGVNGWTAAECKFGSFDSLRYSRIILHGGDNDDCIVGGPGNDIIYGDGGHDFLQGWPGDDKMYGGGGNDFLLGDQGVDSLWGGIGDDILVGGTHDDHIDGGMGHDIFRCRSAGSARPHWDDYGTDLAVDDCGDSNPPLNVEVTQERDPYTQWAFQTENCNAVTFHSQTTSNAELVLNERLGGAVILTVGGDIPVAGDFDSDGRYDDVAVYDPSTGEWEFDYGRDATTDETARWLWKTPEDIPLAGDFDRDGFGDDVAYFRPSERRWDYDYNHDGYSRDARYSGWGEQGDLPVVGDFDRDGQIDDVAVFRPSNRTWYYDYDHNASTDTTSGPWGLREDLPIAGDFDRDGYNDDVAMFRPSDRIWYYDYDRNGTNDVTGGPWGQRGGVPIAGDFWFPQPDVRIIPGARDYNDDVGLFLNSNAQWWYDANRDGVTDPARGQFFGPWGTPCEPLHTTHKQYGNSCGPSSFSMVVEYLGLADHNSPHYYPRDLDDPAEPVRMSEFTAGRAVDVGYLLSQEHIMYEGFHRERELDHDWFYPKEDTASHNFMEPDGRLNTDDGSDAGWHFEIEYSLGNVDWNPVSDTAIGQVQMWTQCCPGVGWKGEDGYNESGLPYIANKFSSGAGDAYPVTIRMGTGEKFANLRHVQLIVKGFIDHKIPLLIAVEDGGHFNTLIGYWDRGSSFYIYTADPLDGWGRVFYNKPMRWRKILLNEEAIRGRVVKSFMFYGHSQGCHGTDDWAREIDMQFGRNTLCGYRR